MVSKRSEDSTVGSQDTKSSTRAKKGKVCLSKVSQRRVRGIVEHVDFNKHGQPVGKTAAEMQSYIGLLTRDHVKINIKNWRLVPQDVKELIWETVKSSYKVPEKWKTNCMESASSKWRTWKTRMYNDFIVPNRDDADKLYQPPPDSGIQQVDWNQFVHGRITSEFKKLSEQQKERRKKHLYPHRLSRKGYARFAEELKESELHGDEEVDRAMMWKKARMRKDEDVENDNLKIAIQKIDDYIREKDEGNFEPSSCSSDLLSRALDKPEHAGRVRSVGAGIKPKSYFKSTRESRREVDEKSEASHAELEVANRRIEEQDGRIHVLDKVIYELVNRIGKLEDKVGEKEKESEGLGSCSVIKASNHETHDEDIVLVDKSVALQGKTVQLFLEISKKLVAYGTVFVTSNVLHGSPMPADCFRVSIDKVVDENALLPFRISDELETVGSALGTHVAWPSHLVEEKESSIQTHDKKKVGKKLFNGDIIKDLSSLPSSLVALYCLMKKSYKDKSIKIVVDVEVFGHEMNVFILTEPDIVPFCKLDPISGNCITAYVWYLFLTIKENATDGNFLFVNLFCISYAPKVSSEDRSRALSERLLEAAPNQIIFVPCNVGEHWILTMFELEKDRVYLMDPLTHRNRDSSWKCVVDTAMNIVNAKKGKKLKKSANWEVIKFKDKSTYSEDEIDEVREEWASCVIKHVFD